MRPLRRFSYLNHLNHLNGSKSTKPCNHLKGCKTGTVIAPSVVSDQNNQTTKPSNNDYTYSNKKAHE